MLAVTNMSDNCMSFLYLELTGSYEVSQRIVSIIHARDDGVQNQESGSEIGEKGKHLRDI